MLRAAALAGAVILSASCNKSESSEGLGLGSAAGSAKAGSGGGFSADLAKDLAGSKPAEPSVAGSADSKPGEKAADSKPEAAASDSKSADSKVADNKPGANDSKAGDSKVADSKASDSKVADSKVASSDPPPKPSEPKLATSDAKPPGKPAPDAKAAAAEPPASHGPVKVSPDLAAIKLSLLPNWDRDIDEPGTFQYVVRIKGTQNTKTFTFRYGYEDAKAPDDHLQYKKYLQDTHALTGDIRDRQRGAAWFLEGNDSSGQPAFRYIVLYGGKRLICYGSLYKDAESNKLGDDRDQTLIQAKQICETLAL